MNKELIYKQLEIMQAAIETVTALLDGCEEASEETECCHPDESKIDMSTMGGEEWICGVCGFHYPNDKEV